MHSWNVEHRGKCGKRSGWVGKKSLHNGKLVMHSKNFRLSCGDRKLCMRYKQGSDMIRVTTEKDHSHCNVAEPVGKGQGGVKRGS